MSALTLSVVRRNLLTRPGYTPYCGGRCLRLPRTRFNGEQFECSDCGWSSEFEPDFIREYKRVAATFKKGNP